MSFFRQNRKLLLVLLGLVAFGVLRAPWENRLREQLVKQRLLLPPPGHTALQQMSQSALMGTLGGLRSLVATYLSLDAFGDFGEKNWDELQRKYRIICNLEPRDETHWVSVVWHIGINATAHVQYYSEEMPKYERERRFQQYCSEAIKLAEDGIKQNPKSAPIRLQLAEVYREKLKDPCNTARVYKDMLGLEGTPGYITRFYGYFLADCPGKEKEAYAYLMRLFQMGEKHHLPTLFVKIKELEEKLNVPFPRRIKTDEPERPDKPKKPSNVLPGGIVVP